MLQGFHCIVESILQLFSANTARRTGYCGVFESLIKHPKAKVTKNLIEESLTSMAQCSIMGH